MNTIMLKINRRSKRVNLLFVSLNTDDRYSYTHTRIYIYLQIHNPCFSLFTSFAMEVGERFLGASGRSWWGVGHSTCIGVFGELHVNAFKAILPENEKTIENGGCSESIG